MTKLLRKHVGVLLALGLGASAPGADSIAVRVNKSEYLVGEPIFCHVRVGAPGAERPIRKVRIEYRIAVPLAEGQESWLEVQAAPLKENRRELMFSLWCEGGDPERGGGRVVTALPGKRALVVRGTWYERLEEHPWVESDHVAFEVRESPKDAAAAARELMELACACSRRYPSGREIVRVRGYIEKAPAAYRPYAGWLLARLYHDERDPDVLGDSLRDLFDLSADWLGSGARVDLGAAEEAMAGFRAEFPNELDERRRTLGLVRAYQSKDEALYGKLLAEYAAIYQYAGRLDLGSIDDPVRKTSAEFQRRTMQLAEVAEVPSDPRKRVEQALGRMWAANDGTVETLRRLFATDGPARRAAMQMVGEERLPSDARCALIEGLSQTSFPERDAFVKDCAMGKYGDELRPGGIAGLRHISRESAEAAVIENLERILDDPPPARDLKRGRRARNSWGSIEMAVQLRIFRAKALLKALADEDVPRAREALKKLEDLERAEGPGK